MSMNPKGLLMKRKRLIKFEKVHDGINYLADLNYPDKVIELKNIKVAKIQLGTSKQNIILDIPPLGLLRLTDWSKKQLGAKVGVNFDKWFRYSKPHEIEEELRRRFTRTGECAKIRARRIIDITETKFCNGYIRAILSPDYFPIDDVLIFDRLAQTYGNQVSEMEFIKNRYSDDFYNDRASHYTMTGEPINLGPIDRNSKNEIVRAYYAAAEKEGLLPDNDWVYQGLHIRNSEVGYTALTIDCTIFRLVCLNGAIVSTKQGRLLYRTHRNIDAKGIDKILNPVFVKMPKAFNSNQQRIIVLRDSVVKDPNEEIEKFLQKQKATKLFIEKTKNAFNEEPINNKYGVWQAIARAAKMELSTKNMEKRFELEEIAGKYLMAA
ncbi:MAG: hypothetical protein ACFFFC_00160 [Candidatus Thorarchaeota archaeon]